MPDERDWTTPAEDNGGGLWRATLLLVALVTIVRIVWLAAGTPYGLVEDEAHYWEWSQRLDWSYYTKPAGIAFVIAASTRIFGSTEFAVRLPAVLFCAIGALAVAGLAADALGLKRARFRAATCFLAAPFFLGGGVLMTVDMPYVACWALACWAGWHAIERGQWCAWVCLGAALGAGFLFKYTTLLLIPGLLVYMLLRRRPLRPAWGPVLTTALLGLSVVPVAVWNQAWGWPTVRHLLGHMGLQGGDQPTINHESWHILWTLEYIGVQVGVVGAPVLLAACYLFARKRRGHAFGPGMTYLLCCAAPILLVYFGVSFITKGEANWAVAGHVTLLCIAGHAAVGAMDRHRRGASPRFDPPRGLWYATLVVGIFGATVLMRPDLLARTPIIGPVVPLGRLTEGRIVASEVDRLVETLAEETGQKPFLMTSHYGIASLLAFYIPQHGPVYCASARLGGGRPTQYDLWSDTDVDDLGVLGGRPAVLLSGQYKDWSGAFERVGPKRHIEVDPEHDRRVTMGYGYRGFPTVESMWWKRAEISRR